MPRDLPNDIVHPTIPPSLTKHSVSLSEWLVQYSTYDGLAVGGFVLRLSPTATSPTTQLLLIRRALTDSFPNVWEPPGGGVDFADPTILHGLIREVWEETGLRVKSIKQQIWADGTGQSGEQNFRGRRGEFWAKLNYVVECFTVKELGEKEEENVDYRVVLDEEEHQDWGWFTREEMERLLMVGEQGKLIAGQAFVAFEEGLKRDGKL